MALLPKRAVSGGFQIPSSGPPVTIIAIPEWAEEPSMVTVFNTDTAAIVYLKWIPLNATNAGFATSDAGIVLNPGSGFTWDHPPRQSRLVALSTVNLAVLATDAQLTVPEEALLL